MIPRYSRPEMAAIWEPENRYRIWFEIEAHACDAQAALGVIPKAAAEAVWKLGKFEPARIDEIERETKHDVIAFLTNLAEHIGPGGPLPASGHDLLRRARHLPRRAAEAGERHPAGRSRPSARRTEAPRLRIQGHAHHRPQPWHPCRAHDLRAEARRALRRLRPRPGPGSSRPAADIATCAISGAVGTFANIDPAVERHVAEKMGLAVEPISTQVIPRDRHAFFFSVLGVIAGSIENLATEIRHLQRSEVREAEEFFSAGQKGSSAMPHKRNPVLSENLTGLARVIRAAVAPALENITLWHERDISHSAVERVIAPDATIALDFALARLTGVIDKLLVYPEAMQRNLDLYGGLVHSQRVLLALTQAGMAREDAYRAVQRNAMRVWQEGADFLTLLKADPGGRGKAPARRARGLLRPRLSHAAGRHDLQAGVRRGLSQASRPSQIVLAGAFPGQRAGSTSS